MFFWLPQRFLPLLSCFHPLSFAAFISWSFIFPKWLKDAWCQILIPQAKCKKWNMSKPQSTMFFDIDTFMGQCKHVGWNLQGFLHESSWNYACMKNWENDALVYHCHSHQGLHSFIASSQPVTTQHMLCHDGSWFSLFRLRSSSKTIMMLQCFQHWHQLRQLWILFELSSISHSNGMLLSQKTCHSWNCIFLPYYLMVGISTGVATPCFLGSHDCTKPWDTTQCLSLRYKGGCVVMGWMQMCRGTMIL